MGRDRDEVARRYPCDDIVPAPVVQAWRGVTVDAGPDAVWPGLTQIRPAPYSYYWIDNCGRRWPRELRGLPEPSSASRSPRWRYAPPDASCPSPRGAADRRSSGH
jgi:hypothetical protein